MHPTNMNECRRRQSANKARIATAIKYTMRRRDANNQVAYGSYLGMFANLPLILHVQFRPNH